MPETLTLMYLTDDGRHFNFETFVKMLSNMKNKKQVILLVLTHCNDLEFYNNILKTYNIQQFLIQHFDPYDNYMNKVRFTIQFSEQNNIKYICKYDNDIILTSALFDYMVDNLAVLNDNTHFILSPTLTSGIPSIEYFLDDFATKDEQNSIREEFRKLKIPDFTMGQDYSSLNTQVTKWDYKHFFQQVSNIPHVFKGIHPHRISADLHEKLNSIVINHRDDILNAKNFNLFIDNSSPYICNSVFIIRTDRYKDVINQISLFKDGFEEVPLNLRMKELNADIVFVRNGCGIHSYYNTIPNNRELEKTFMDCFFHSN